MAKKLVRRFCGWSGFRVNAAFSRAIAGAGELQVKGSCMRGPT